MAAEAPQALEAEPQNTGDESRNSQPSAGLPSSGLPTYDHHARTGVGKPHSNWFKPGVVMNPAGRPKGSKNRLTVQARECAKAILDDPEYLRRLKARALAGTLPPPIEAMLWHYRYGKPVENIKLLDVPEDVSQMSDDALESRAYEIIQVVQERRLRQARLKANKDARQAEQDLSVGVLPEPTDGA